MQDKFSLTRNSEPRLPPGPPVQEAPPSLIHSLLKSSLTPVSLVEVSLKVRVS